MDEERRNSPLSIYDDGLSALAHISHGFFTRKGGASSGDYDSLNCGFGSGDERGNITRNRAAIASSLGVEPENLLTVYQHHSPDTYVVSESWKPEDAPKADAMVTNQPGIALGILTADCAPVLFADPKAKVIGAAHSGWSGAISGVVESTLAAMMALGADRDNICVRVGPTIGPSSYEVGPEFHVRFMDKHPGNFRFFKPSDKAKHYMFDLPGFVCKALKDIGLKNVEWTGQCTYENEDQFFSYRRATHRKEADYGRQISVIALKE